MLHKGWEKVRNTLNKKQLKNTLFWSPQSPLSLFTWTNKAWPITTNNAVSRLIGPHPLWRWITNSTDSFMCRWFTSSSGPPPQVVARPTPRLRGLFLEQKFGQLQCSGCDVASPLCVSGQHLANWLTMATAVVLLVFVIIAAVTSCCRIFPFVSIGWVRQNQTRRNVMCFWVDLSYTLH